MQRQHQGLAGLLALSLAGCTSAVSHDVYSSYRATRLATDEDTAIRAMAEHVEAYPTSPWAEPMRATLAGKAERLGDVALGVRCNEPGLERFARLFPDHQRAPLARAMLVRCQRRPTEAVGPTEATTGWARAQLGHWTPLALGADGYGLLAAAFAAENPALARAFGEALNRRPTASGCAASEDCVARLAPARCLEDEPCLALVMETRFRIAQPRRTLLWRDLEIVVRLHPPVGGIQRTEILLPGRGFSRWYELEHPGEVVEDFDPPSRERAVQWAQAELAAMFGEAGDWMEGDVAVVRELAPLRAVEPPTAVAPAEPVEAPADEPLEGCEPDDDLCRYLEQATGGREATPESEAAAPVDTAPTEAALPALRRATATFTNAELRVVLFAATAENPGEALDGFYVEARPEN